MDLNKLSVFISLILRHKPEVINIKLDNYGYANVEELILGINKTGRKIDMDALEEIVKTDNKGRYSFNSDKTKIRANQGHSINVDVELKEETPPKYLYHGTSTRFLYMIEKEGIRPMSRLYVHLSEDKETAINVGSRHGEPIILKIDTEKMINDGFRFLISENGVWLTKYISPIYFSID